MNYHNLKIIDELSRSYALTNDQLLEYLLLNDIDVFNDDFKIDLKNKKINTIFKKLKAQTKQNHDNKSGLKKIIINKLFGKYNYELEFTHDIVIWIAENGTGKTTILTIIVAILTGDATILYDIDFKEIIIELENGESLKINKQNENVNKKNDAFSNFLQSMVLDELDKYIPTSLYLSIKRDLINKGYIEVDRLDKVITRLPQNVFNRNPSLKNNLAKLKELTYSDISHILEKIKDTIKKEVVFYPTYRRVEVGIEKIFDIDYPFFDNRELISKYMSFGMKDVKTRIKNLLEKLRQDANVAYTNMNIKIISELLEDSLAHYLNNSVKVDNHKIEVVIKRIGEDKIDNYKKLKFFLENQDKSTENDASHSSKAFLKYYFNKLVEIYDLQEPINTKLRKFAEVSSRYLSGKKIEYDETMLTMRVLDIDNFEIDLDDLSSGEKQIVSIFSKVYLDVTSPCIFVIDEPELSLSIEWQKQFLKDIYESEKVALLIATTHSPFIFENKYFDYVRELEASREKSDEQQEQNERSNRNNRDNLS